MKNAAIVEDTLAKFLPWYQQFLQSVKELHLPEHRSEKSEELAKIPFIRPPRHLGETLLQGMIDYDQPMRGTYSPAKELEQVCKEKVKSLPIRAYHEAIHPHYDLFIETISIEISTGQHVLVTPNDPIYHQWDDLSESDKRHNLSSTIGLSFAPHVFVPSRTHQGYNTEWVRHTKHPDYKNKPAAITLFFWDDKESGEFSFGTEQEPYSEEERKSLAQLRMTPSEKTRKVATFPIGGISGREDICRGLGLEPTYRENGEEERIYIRPSFDMFGFRRDCTGTDEKMLTAFLEMLKEQAVVKEEIQAELKARYSHRH